MTRYDDIDAYIKRLIRESTPEATVWNIEKIRQGKKANWNYIDGCMLTALLEMYRLTGDREFFDFTDRVADAFVREDGTVRTYDPEKRSLDDVMEGRILFSLYEGTQKEKYRRGADYLYRCLMEQPRTFEGSFWHKAIYPNQVWLDGLYMGQVFSALYQKHFGAGDYSDPVRQVLTVRQRMFDEKAGLYYHGYDASRSAFWADPVTGCSKSFWLRALGWFTAALADLYEIIPASSERETIGRILRETVSGEARYRDAASGMYWQVPNQPGRDGNYLESSGSAMLAYAMMKGARLGALDADYAALGRGTFDGIIDRYLTVSDGNLNLGGICLVAGLGPETDRRRDGTYGYYISEPVVENDAKGVAPFILCYTEVYSLKGNG